ncbi:MAG: nucleotidyltransferase domain-containing protein [Armatimonadota bacterium]|nr:nucleotidyltransferase domain-containing protein [bacterium]MDW8104160.1 nucleotidyltransferase domain-containing protein [Armatimonadota bacterium]MDW8290264.1 nucleotidyltransferase domain-containing protein [Armatimonadota bacterium]
MLKWLDAETVLNAVEAWAKHTFARHPEVVCIGLFGSYARGDWGVGSDIDLVVVVHDTATPFVERARYFDTSDLPLSTDLLVYTQAEWEKMLREGRFAQRIEREARWFYPDSDAPFASESALS